HVPTVQGHSCPLIGDPAGIFCRKSLESCWLPGLADRPLPSAPGQQVAANRECCSVADSALVRKARRTANNVRPVRPPCPGLTSRRFPGSRLGGAQRRALSADPVALS